MSDILICQMSIFLNKNKDSRQLMRIKDFIFIFWSLGKIAKNIKESKNCRKLHEIFYDKVREGIKMVIPNLVSKYLKAQSPFIMSVRLSVTHVLCTSSIIRLWIFLKLPIKILNTLIDADISPTRFLTQIYKRTICTITWEFNRKYKKTNPHYKFNSIL